MAKTQAEELFECFCNEHGIGCRKIDESEERSPDYELTICGVSVIAEIKEIEPNDAEKASHRLLAKRGYGECLSNVPGDRVRSKIRKASPQIRKHTDGTKPGILVLFNRGMVAGHIAPYNIRVAMCGLEQVHIAVPRNAKNKPYIRGMSHGPKRKMTEEANTSISAIGAMYMINSEAIRLDLYHNRHAEVPLVRNAIHNCGISQYDLEEGGAGGTTGWKPFEP